jgi:hypothetical protein
LLAWLSRRAAGHVEQLHLHLGDYRNEQDSSAELLAALTTSLTSCAARLADVQLSVIGLQVPWDVSATVSALSHLRRLVIVTDSKRLVASSMAALTALEDLKLGFSPVKLCGPLPLTLTRLELRLFVDTAMLPAQVRLCAAV